MDTDTPQIDLSSKSMSELVQMYNTKAELMDRPPVKRFADRATAEKRVSQIINAIGGVAGKSVPEIIKTEDEKPKEEVTGSEVTESDTANDNTTETATEGKDEGDMATKTTKGKTKAKANGKPKAAGAKKKTNGELVGKGSFRDKLLSTLETNLGKQVSISKLMTSVYGESRKDYKGPLMMVMKGLKAVLADNRTGKEIRKTRENKENYFGLHKK